MRKYIHVFILIAIMLFALGIRWYRSAEFLPFSQEQADELLSVHTIWHNIQRGDIGHIPLKGPPATYRWILSPRQEDPIYHGVLTYYLLLPAAVISHFDPYGVVVFMMIVGVAQIYLLYKAGRDLFADRVIGLVAAGLGAISFWLAAYSRWIWNPSFIPFFSLLSLVAFLKILKRSHRWWYVFVLAVSCASQVHASGYILLLFWVAMLFWYRPAIPKGTWNRIFLVVLFFLPLLPTIIYEVTHALPMVRALSGIALGSFATLRVFPQSLVLVFFDAIGLSITQMSVLLPVKNMIVHSVLPIGIVLAITMVVGVASAMRRLIHMKRWQDKFWMILWFWVLFLPTLVYVEYVYGPSSLNDYARMNNFLFAFPMFLLCISYGFVWIWRRNRVFGRIFVLGMLLLYSVVNIGDMQQFFWSYSDSSWAYADVNRLGTSIPGYASGQPYDLVLYRYGRGSFVNTSTYEPLYFIFIAGGAMPETFNGVSYWGNPPIDLRARSTHQIIILVDPEYVSQVQLPAGASYVGNIVGYTVYRALK